MLIPDVRQTAMDGFLGMQSWAERDSLEFIERYPILSFLLNAISEMFAKELDIDERDAFSLVFTVATTVIETIERSNPPSIIDEAYPTNK